MLFLAIICVLINVCAGYTIYTLDDPHVCNESIYLEDGPKSAAILKLTANDFYDFSKPIYCTVSFVAPMHHWSGLTGVIEQMDLRRQDDQSGYLISPYCVDYITVDTDMPKTPTQDKKICGTWSMVPGNHYSKFDYKKALVGYCPIGSGLENSKKCHVTKLTVTISIGIEKEFVEPIVDPHRGFTFVVSAYSYPTQNGESECREGLKACSQPYTLEAKMGFFHCIHESLWCDDHINCGFVQNSDELSCSAKGRELGNLIVTVIVPWMGAFLLLLMISTGLLYLRYFRLMNFVRERRRPQDFNSYAESYELSSNLPSAHHMAIQVRVVCNSNHPHYNSRDVPNPWQGDLPPEYDALFPQGPPLQNIPQNVTSITATVEGGARAVGVNVTSVNTSVSATPPVTTTPSTANSTADITSIDLNVVQNNASPESKVFGKTFKSGGAKTSLTVTVTQEPSLESPPLSIEEPLPANTDQTVLCSIEAQESNLAVNTDAALATEHF